MLHFATPTDRINFAIHSIRHASFTNAGIRERHGDAIADDTLREHAKNIADNAGLDAEAVERETFRMARAARDVESWNDFIIKVRFDEDFLLMAVTECAS